tara:strand:- start:195 stop:512 length:318 start_codon:yes stop_codon:yes gene_type:complete
MLVDTPSSNYEALARSYAQSKFGANRIQLVSDTNNAVFLADDRWIVKIVTDDEIDLRLWCEVAKMLQDAIPVARILDVVDVPSEQGLRIVSSEVIPGRDLASYIH